MKKIIVIILSFIFLKLTACVNLPKNDLYISFIVTHNTSNKEELYSEIAYFNLEEMKVKIVDEITYKSQYPLGVYNKSNNSIYYTSREDNSNIDHIYKKNITSCEVERITTNLFTTKCIMPKLNELYTVSVETGGYVILNLYNIDENQTLNNIKIKEGLTISAANYNPIKDEVIVVGHDFSEQMSMYETQEFSLLDGHIYIIDNQNIKLVKNINYSPLSTIVSVCNNDKKIIYTTGSTLIIYDIQNQKVIEKYIDDGRISRLIYLTENNYLYYLTHTNSESKICRYNIETNVTEIIYEVSRSKTIINNAQIVKS